MVPPKEEKIKKKKNYCCKFPQEKKRKLERR